MRILTAAQMRDADRTMIDDIGLPSIVLMENAGRQVAAALQRHSGDLAGQRVGVLCGRGNNGGDGLVVARALAEQDVEVEVFLVAPPGPGSADFETNLRVARRLEIPVIRIVDAPPEASTGVGPGGEEADANDGDVLTWTEARAAVGACDVIVDALLGTGVSRPLEGLLQQVVADVNASGRPVVAIDLPSGLMADDPAFAGECIEADVTVTLAAPKPAVVLWPAAGTAGDLVVADIGIPATVIDEVEGDRVELLTEDDVALLVLPRPLETHKGDAGRVLVVAGGDGTWGAAGLVGRGALRGGAGLVTVATRQSGVPVVAGFAAEYMTLPLPETATGDLAPEARAALDAVRCDVIAVGPGLGITDGVATLVGRLLAEAEVPLVLDADALTVIAAHPELLARKGVAPVVMTPHPGEMARLVGRSVAEVGADRIGTARAYAVDHGVTIVLKGAQTVIAGPDGMVWVNTTGNPGMATAGAGDVLTGVVAAWVAQLGQPTLAACAAVFLHGRSGDLARARHGEMGLTASDLVESLGAAAGSVGRSADGPDPEAAARPGGGETG